jgi:hypothetical protein
MSEAIDLSSGVAKEIAPGTSELLVMAANAKYEPPRVSTHRLDGVAVDGPLTMSGNV